MKRILLMIVLLSVLVGCQSKVEPKPEKLVIVGETTVEVGDVIKLNTNISSTVNWFTSDPEIATVSNGFVTGISEGTVMISAEKATNMLIFDSVEITVIKKPVEIKQEEIVYYQTKILSINSTTKKVELLNCPFTNYDDDTKFVKLIDEQISLITINDFYIGLTNIYVACDKTTNMIKTMMMVGELGFSNIRVGIRKTISDFTDETTLYHDEISMRFTSEGYLQVYNGSFKNDIAAGTTLRISISSGRVRVANGSITVLESYNRVIFGSYSEEIIVSSITRSVGNPKYAGTLEVSMNNNRLVLVNDVDIEDYLTKVVPSEMPASYHSEALKAQAIAARSYAYMDIFNKSHDALGYTVDDSVKSQVYNNINTSVNTNLAVEATKGLVMMHGSTLVQAYFYSTSSGLTASAHDVWITSGEKGEVIPYLIGRNLTSDSSQNPLPFDYTSEASALNFFKTIKMTTPDTNTSYHRWKVTFTKEHIANMLNRNLANSYNANPNLVLTKQGSSWVTQAIPNDIGTVNNMYVEKRGESGVVISLVIETSTGIYKLINQYTIRFTLRPAHAGSQVLVYGANSSQTNYTSTWSSPANLYSGFFAIEASGNNFTIYGGGNGHGVGMSQNGANGLAKSGASYITILSSYYSSIDLVDISYEYEELLNFEQVLQFARSLS